MTIAAVAGVRYVISQPLTWLWTDELGTLNPALQHAGALAVAGLAAACIVIGGLIGLRRAAPASRPSLALGFLAIALASSFVLWSTLRFSQPQPATTRSPGRPVPSSPVDVFTDESWSTAERYVQRYRDTPWEVRQYVPYDPEILGRVSFIGLTLAEVRTLLERGSWPITDSDLSRIHLSYEMVPSPECLTSFLSFELAYGEQADLVVVKEDVRSRHSCNDRRPDGPGRP